MIPLINVYRSNNEAKYVEDATLNGWGNDRDKYTNMFAAKLGTIFKNKNLILTSSFHGALHILVKALSLRPNDEIIAPKYIVGRYCKPVRLDWFECQVRRCFSYYLLYGLRICNIPYNRKDSCNYLSACLWKCCRCQVI